MSNIRRPEIAAIADWLIDGARSAAAPQQVLAVLCERLVAAGVPLWRAAVFVRTLHPEIAGRRFIWRQGEDVDISDLPYEGLQQPEYRDGVFLRVVETAAPVRRRLDAAPGTADSAVLAQLREQGATDCPTVWSGAFRRAVRCGQPACAGRGKEPADPPLQKPRSQPTLRRREMDSNFRFRSR